MDFAKSEMRPDDHTGPGHGPQGNDKAPGEEESTDTDNMVEDSQKGKGKNDGDPSKPEDQPVKPTS